MHPCCKIRAIKCVKRTIALYQKKLFNLFPFSVIEFCEVVICSNLGHNMCDRNQGFFFFLRHAQPPLELWLRTLQCFIQLRTLDHKALCFSLHLTESVVREIQKTKRSVIVLFYLLLVERLRFSLVYLCVQFAAEHHG